MNLETQLKLSIVAALSAKAATLMTRADAAFKAGNASLAIVLGQAAEENLAEAEAMVREVQS